MPDPTTTESWSAVVVDGLVHHYGTLLALDHIGFRVARGTIFGFLGPNGGGKTTLFRLVSTLLPVQRGRVEVLGIDVATRPSAVRRQIGVTFQSPSLDRKLTVFENLKFHGLLFGLSGQRLTQRIGDLLSRLGMSERSRDRVESLSGGLARRVEIAKGLLHDPQVLLLDEPSTGLDPGARLDLWRYLRSLRDAGVTVIVTTHLMEEAERCDELALLDHGRIVALGTPDSLRRSLGGDCLTIRSAEPERLAADITAQFDVVPRILGPELRIEAQSDHLLLGRLLDAFGSRIEGVSLARPTLEDVFVEKTGHRFWSDS